MPSADPACPCPSNTKKKKQKRNRLPFLSGLLIALLPKCHFCLLAYSSAITLCSGAKFYNHEPIWSNYLSIGLALFILLMLLYNFRGKRTYVAILFVLIGSSLITRSELMTGELTPYYWGSSLLLLGVWINGSFYYFFNKAINRFQKKQIKHKTN